MKHSSTVKTVFVFNWWLNSNGGGVKKHNIELVNSLKRDYGLLSHVMYCNGEDENSTKLHKNFFSRVLQILTFLSISKPRSVVIEGGLVLAFSCLIYKYLVNKKCYLIGKFTKWLLFLKNFLFTVKSVNLNRDTN